MLPLATEWVLPNGLRAGDLPPQQLAAFPPEIGMADVGFHPLRQGAFTLDISSYFHVPVTVEAKVLLEEPLLAIRMPFMGRAQIRNGRASLEESAERWTLSMMTESTCRIDNHPGVPYVATVSVFTASRLRTLLDGGDGPLPLRRFLDGQCDAFDAEVQTSTALRQLASRLRSNPYRDGMADLYREGLIYQFMATALSDFTGEVENPRRVLSRDQRRAFLARDILLAYLSTPPAMEDLARQVGTSQRRLTEAFKAVFDASPFQCLVQWRLDQAREILRGGTISVKQVAALMGYAHVSSFSHAYARRFGRSPVCDRESAQ